MTTAVLTDLAEVARILGQDGFAHDTAICTCGYRRASHSSYDQADKFVGIGMGVCGFYSVDCPRFVATGTYSVAVIEPDAEQEAEAHRAWIARRQQALYWLHPETVVDADRAALVREQFARGDGPAWLYTDPETIRRLTT